MSSVPSNSGDKSLSIAVIEAVATEMEIHPTELSELLHDVLDADALDALFGDRDSSSGKVIFSYCGYSITAAATGHVSVEAEEVSQG
ncbi:hypothetical protein C5C07_19600 [Haloferax sp. Atlit-4N]|uniref:HalOD1 output domain-containing protein n=1 Tax=unclassified Haloferax TaxID=2625095 RepID=UPI000E2353A5|nr:MULTISPECIES: HalOD1 output domain-containing protein [unclassified Haloferax]RDZ39517.1 hypothetical protein C5B86_19155 [Haloferax sp. Atlit-19N]RDZ50177.1 hypothetical protein C5C07_19600 [Haloferax sp. Atlit-4N]